jgi:hypothetical protein
VDYQNFSRGVSWDIGGIEYGSTPPEDSCGDNTKDVGEVCDGTDLDGEDCVSQGFVSGTLACSVGCGSFDTSGCVAAAATQAKMSGRAIITGRSKIQ